MAKVKTANQEFPIPDEWVALVDENEATKKQRDERLRRLLSNFVPSINNAQLSYTNEGDETIVRVTAQLGTKGMNASSCMSTGMQCDLSEIHRVLSEAPPYLPPVLALAWELKCLQISGGLTLAKLIEYQPKIQKVLTEHHPSFSVERIHQCLQALPPAPCPVAPLGF